ncbi:hypothetical protein AJ78_08632 [Emergomyces pasteurianus Ep9510]|uniref:Uncharacterized protein n=1 Tax=Emergomyces pasteurianus Ep9510 TaxID=1447872 RepID=A0A1J9PR30_9EURO|nr:hypothetical protein AJ78_08632 [Emergomyces pasteurianus Ep9510]
MAAAARMVPNNKDSIFAWHVRLEKRGLKLLFCEVCKLGKSKKQISRIPIPRATKRGVRLHFDIAGGGESLGIWMAFHPHFKDFAI